MYDMEDTNLYPQYQFNLASSSGILCKSMCATAVQGVTVICYRAAFSTVSCSMRLGRGRVCDTEVSGAYILCVCLTGARIVEGTLNILWLEIGRQNNVKCYSCCVVEVKYSANCLNLSR